MTGSGHNFRMNRILILNLASDGHYPRYTRWILDSQACREAEVILAGPSELFTHPELHDFNGRFRPHPVNLPADKGALLAELLQSG